MQGAEDLEVDVAAVMRSVRADVLAKLHERNRLAPPSGVGSAADEPGLLSLARLPAQAGEMESKAEYELGDFLASHGEALVRNAYRALLGREPDVEGLAAYARALSLRRRSRVEVIGRIRYSSEGRARAVRVRGLPLSFAFDTACRIPLVGRLLEWGRTLVMLPRLVRQYEASDALWSHRHAEAIKAVNANSLEIEGAFNRLARSAVSIEEMRAVRERADWQETHLRQLTERAEAGDARSRDLCSRAQLDERIDALTAVLASKSGREELTHLANHLVDLTRARVERTAFETYVRSAQDAADALREVVSALDARVVAGIATLRDDVGRKLRALDPAATALPRVRNDGAVAPPGTSGSLGTVDGLDRATEAPDEPLKGQVAADAALDSLYLALQDRFRGSAEDIRHRAGIYLPILHRAGAGTAERPILDVGCGRGEFLEVLRDAGLAARGVDPSPAMVDRCRANGLAIVRSDALAYMASLPDCSVGAVTAIHVVEHLPFPKMVAMFDEFRRVLTPGGVAIVETPNPENLVVAACNFHADPTHVRPIPPDMAQFLMQARGFHDVTVRRLTSAAEDMPRAFTESDPHHVLNPFIHALRHNFFSAPDYAVIAIKP